MFNNDPISSFYPQNELQSEELLAVIFEYMGEITAETNLDKLLMILADLGKISSLQIAARYGFTIQKLINYGLL